MFFSLIKKMKEKTILDAIGNTPIIKLQNITKNSGHDFYAKLEYLNPGGSYKDRIAKYILDKAIETGKLKKGGTIVECTSGNTGIGIAIWAAVNEFRCIFTISDKQSPDKIALLKSFGAKVVICPTYVSPEDPRSYYSVAKKIAAETENSYLIDQYNNPLNREAHYHTTGPEIYEQMQEELDIICFPAGTGGMVTGTSQYLKEKMGEKIKTVAVDAKGSILKVHSETGKITDSHPYLLEGVGADFIPKNFDYSVIDSWVEVSDKDGFLTTRKLLRLEGIYAGGSSGMCLFGAMEFCKQFGAKKKILVVLCDSGTRYVNKLYSDVWMKDKGFLA